MRATKIVGVGLAVVVMIGAFAAASASAEPPEFGRCLKQAPKSLSNYDNGKCVKLASEDAGTEAEKLSKGNFPWFPGVVNNKFTITVKEGTYASLESVGGAKITCTGGTGSGEYTGNKMVGGIVVKFNHCETGGGKCNSAGEPVGVITTNELDGILGIWQTGETQVTDKPGILLKPTSGETLVEFACINPVVKVTKSFILPVPPNAMKLAATLHARVGKGKQKPENFAEGPTEVLQCSFQGWLEQCGLGLALIQTNEEKVEVNTVL